MSSFLRISLVCLSQATAEAVARHLSRDGRIDFEEDVPKGERGIYIRVDGMAFPAHIECADARLTVTWEDEDDDPDVDFRQMKRLGQIPGVTIEGAYEIPDDPLSADDDPRGEDVDGWFWVRDAGRWRQLRFREWKSVVPEELATRLKPQR